eukprot:510865_1
MVWTDILAYISTAGWCACSIMAGETVQIADTAFNYPFALRWLNVLQMSILCLPIVPMWKCYRSYFNLSTHILKQSDQYNVLLWFIFYSILLSIIGTSDVIIANISLQEHNITVPTSNAISGMNPIPVYILSVLFLKQKITKWQIIALIMAIIGILFFVFELNSSNHTTNTETYDTLYGIILTIIWVVWGTVGSIIIKKVSNEYYEKDKYIIGCLLCLTIHNIAGVVIFPWTMFYPDEISINTFTMNSFVWVIINGFVYFFWSIFGFIVVTLKSPMYISIASLTAIPISFVVDVFVHDYKFNVYAIFGTIFIMGSYLMFEIIKPKHINNKPTDYIISKEKDGICPIDPIHGLLNNVNMEKNNYGTISMQ